MTSALFSMPEQARPRMNEAEIKAIVDQFADVAPVLHEADPADKAEVFRQLTSRQADGSSKRDRQRPG